MRRAAALCVVLAGAASASPPPATTSSRYSDALFVEVGAGFVPYANDLPVMLGVGVRVGAIHELWARLGYFPTGDDGGHGLVCAGYRAVLRPGRLVRPFFGVLLAAVPATCDHDRTGRPRCSSNPLFIAAATAGLRLEPFPWLGIAAAVSLGADSFPNPFGIFEVALSFALPRP